MCGESLGVEPAAGIGPDLFSTQPDGEYTTRFLRQYFTDKIRKGIFVGITSIDNIVDRSIAGLPTRIVKKAIANYSQRRLESSNDRSRREQLE